MACSTPDSEVSQLQKQAKEDTIEKLNLPKGTQISDESFTIKKAEGPEEDNFELYAVTVNIQSDNGDGQNTGKTQVLLYTKIIDEKNQPIFRLLSFE